MSLKGVFSLNKHSGMFRQSLLKVSVKKSNLVPKKVPMKVPLKGLMKAHE